MKASQQLLKFIESWEGCKLTVYNDAGGRPTIGIGHLLMPGESHDPITEAQALAMLGTDIRVAETAVNHAVHAALTQNQTDALISLCYNIGQGNFAKSQCLKDVNLGNFDNAGDDFLNWNHVNGQVSQGLTNRREAERDMFLNGVYGNHI